MYKYIGIENLVACALIELMKKEESNRKISMQMLYDYGVEVVKYLVDSGQGAILLITKDSTYEFIHDYSEYFSIEISENKEYIQLKEDVNIDDLRNVFRKNLTIDLAKAMFRRESLAVLGI